MGGQRVKGHKLFAVYLVRNLTTGRQNYYAMCECNAETQWVYSPYMAKKLHRQHKADVLASRRDGKE